MSWNTWAIDGSDTVQVKHPASLARLQTYAAHQGTFGVIDPLDLRVLAAEVPNTTVRVMPGAASVPCKAGNVRSQAYEVELTEPDVIPITPTDAGGGRSDLIVVRVENPFLAGESYDLPDEPEEGPYTYVRVIQGVPSGTSDYYELEPGQYGNVLVSPYDSVITLARLDLPASTGTVLQSHLTELRSIAEPGGTRHGENTIEMNPWTESRVHRGGPDSGHNPPSAPDPSLLTPGTGYQNWPPEASWDLPIPEWATGAEIWIDVDAQLQEGNAWGDCVVQINGETAGAPTQFNHTLSGQRENITVKHRGTVAIPAEVRGTIANIRLSTRNSSANGHNGTLWAKWWTYSTLFVHFKKYPVYG